MAKGFTPRKYFVGYIRRKDFAPDCAKVCGNCVHWADELMAWGRVSFCKLDWKPVEPGDLCRMEGKTK